MAINPFKDLRELVVYLEKRGLLRRVRTAVSPQYELSEVTERTGRLENGGPVLLFERVNGGVWPVLTNLLGSTGRLAWTLGLNNLSELDEGAMALLNPAGPLDLGERLARLGETSYLARYAPRLVRAGPCQEITLTTLPTLPLIKDRPDEAGAGWRSVLILTQPPRSNNTQAVGGDLVGIGDELFLRGLTLEPGESRAAAVAVGGDPALFFAAHAPLLPTLDPLTLAGSLARRRLDVVRAKTNEIEVPATAEIVLEGRASAYSSGLALFQPTLLTHRKDPLLLVGAPHEAAILVRASERLLLPILRQTLPEIEALRLPAGADFQGLALVSIHKTYPGQAQRVMHGLWGAQQLRFLRHILVVDADCDLSQPARLLDRVLSDLDPAHDLLTVKGPLSTGVVGSKLGLDATRKLPGEVGFVQPSTALTQDLTHVRQQIAQKWLEYGIE